MLTNKKRYRICTYIKENKWEILFITFMLVCLGWTIGEIYIGFALGLF